MEETTNTELVRSHVDTFILKTLQSKDSYPYEILREIEDLSSGKYVLKQATLYSCMKRLEKVGYINSYWGTESEGGRRRYYSLTERGTDFLKKDQVEWEFSRTLINRLLSDKEVDLETALPPFDASSLRPLTKRGTTKASDPETSDSAASEQLQVTVPFVLLNQATEGVNGVDKEEKLPEQRSKHAENDATDADTLLQKLKLFENSTKGEVNTVDFLNGAQKDYNAENFFPENGNAEKLSMRETGDRSALNENPLEKDNSAPTNEIPKIESARCAPVAKIADEGLEYLTKDPIFQHTLPEDCRNSTTQEALRFELRERCTPNGAAARETNDDRTVPAHILKETGRVEETEDMRAAADLLHIGKKYVENEILYASSMETAKSETKNPASSKRTAENYRDVLNRIFSADVLKTNVKPTEEKESAAAQLPATAGAPHGRHLKELQAGLEKQGYTLRIYSPKNRSDYYYNRYLYQNKINFAVNLLLFVIMAAEFIIVAGLNGILEFNALTLVFAGIAMCMPPLVAALFYFWNPTKRVRSNYNFMQNFLYRSILALILIALQVIVCLLVPTFGISFDNPRMYVPWIFCFDIPLYAVLYELLYRSKRFHLSCVKF